MPAFTFAKAMIINCLDCQDGLLVLCGFLRSKDKFVASHRWISSFDISAAENPDLVGFGEFVHQREDM